MSDEDKRKPEKGLLSRFAASVAFDGAKTLLLWLAGLALPTLAPFVTAYFLDSSLGRDPSGAFTWRQFLSDIIESPPADSWLSAVFGSWWQSAIIFSVIALIVALTFLLLRYQRRIRSHIRAFSQAENALETIGFHSVVAGPEAQAAWDLLLEDIRDPRTTTISILGASGWETFGDPRSPLHKVLREFKGAVKILLVDTRSSNLEKRAASVNAKPTEYRRQIQDSHTLITDLKAAGHDIESRVYKDPPAWKLIITTHFCWAQYYTRNQHVNETPVYLFYNGPSPASLYHRYSWEFTRVWNASVPARKSGSRS